MHSRGDMRLVWRRFAVGFLVASWTAACAGGTGETETGGSGGLAEVGGSSSFESGGSSGKDEGAGGDLAGTGGAGAPLAECELSESDSIQTSKDGQVIENVHIVSTEASAIRVDHDDVVIRNVWVEHSGGKGIVVTGDDVLVENVHVRFTSAPETGPNSDASFINIECNGASFLRVDGARLERGSSGICLVNCPDSHLSRIEGYDFRGPYPRGQVVQWNASDRGVLEDFSVISPSGSWPEDNVNVYKSADAVIRRGVVDGNNAPSGVGVIFDGGTSTGLVEDVDAIHMGNGCFSGYAGGEDVTFSRTRCRDNVCSGQDGREAPKSNSLMWAGSPERTMQRILDSKYAASCNGNISWPASAFEQRELEEQEFVPRSPIELFFCWE